MADNLIAAELLQQINLTKIRPTSNYLSATDALTVEEFEQSEYGSDCSLDVSNIEWGKACNDSHVFDIFSKFTTQQDSSKTRLDMLDFVAANNEHYKCDCHVFFSMHEIYLDTWVNKMAYWGTKADELSVHTLSDMLKVHSFIVNKHHPWTTVDASVTGTPLEILHLCPVKLVFLGDNRFGRLWHKLQPAPSVSTLQTGLLLVFPDAQPVRTDRTNPTLTELETAETLLTMHDAPLLDLHLKDLEQTVNVDMELQEPIVMTLDQPCELIVESTPVINASVLEDAMDKVVNHEDISFTDPINWLKFRDCMDLVTGRVSELVESVNLDNLFVLDLAKTKHCWIELV